MPIEQSVEEFFPVSKADKEKSAIIGYIKDILSEGDKLATIKDKLSLVGLGFGDSKKAADELNSTLKSITQSVNTYTESVIKSEKVKQQEAKTQEALNKAKKEQVKTDIEVVKQIEAEEKAEQSILRTQKARLAEQEKQQKITSNEAKIISDASNEYLQLNKALQDAELKYKNLYLTQIKGDASTQEATKEALNNALSIRKVLNTVDQSLGNYQRNVGNYASGFNGLNNSIQQILREAPSAAVSLNTFFLAISNNLPMFFDEIAKIKKAQQEALVVAKEAAIVAKEQATAQALAAGVTKEAAVAEGLLAEQTALANAQTVKAPSLLKQIGGSLFSVNTALTLGVLALTLFGGKIIDFIGSLFNANKAVDRFKEVHQTLVNTMNEAAKSSASEVVGLRVLEKAATDVSKPMEVRLKAVKDLQDEYPKYLGNVSQEAILHGDAAKQINLVADALYKKAFAEAASSKAASVAGQQLDLELRRNFLIQEQQKSQARLNQLKAKAVEIDLTGTGAINPTVAAVISEEKHLNEINKLLKNNGDQSKFNAQQIEFFTNKAAENFDKVKSLEIDPKDKKKKHIKDIADVIATLRAELAGIDRKLELGELSPKDADIEKVKAYGKAISDIYKTDESKSNKRAASVKLKVELDPINERVFLRDIDELVAKVKNKDRIDLLPPDKDTQKRFNDLRERLKTSYKTFADDEAKFNDEILQRELVAQETAILDEQKMVEDAYNDNKLSKEGYERALLDIQLRYAKERALSNIEYLEKEVKLYGEGTKAKEDAEKRLAEARLMLSKNVHDVEKANNDELIKEIQKVQGYVNDAIGIVGGLIDISVTKQKNALRELEDQQQKNYDNQVERINSSTLTDAQKADQLKILDAQRQAQKDTFDRKNREADQKKAAFDKATAISNIIFSTAVAVIKALPDIVLAAVVGAIGAAQLAIAIATPLPKYATGVMNKQTDSFGIAGEAGPERVERPGYAPIVVDKETAMFMPRGTNVIPLGSDKINGAMYLGMMQQQAKKEKQSETDMLLRVLVQEAKKKKPTVNNFIVRDTATYQRQKQKYYGQA